VRERKAATPNRKADLDYPPEYRTPGEMTYYNCDLSKFVAVNCIKEMTCMDTDVVIYKRTKNRIRYIEYKHWNEHVEESQLEVLRHDGNLYARINKDETIQREVCLVRGNFNIEPFQMKVHNFTTDEDLVFDNEQDFKWWMEFENPAVKREIYETMTGEKKP